MSNSLMFDSVGSQYLSRTPSVAGSPNKWTWSGWVKRGMLGSPQLLFSAATDGSNFEYFRFESTDELFYARYVGGAAQDTLTTTAKFRDPSAWLHVVVNRNGAVRTIYINGIQVASGGSSAATGEIGQNKAHSIGRRQETTSQYFDGYLADVNFVDSGALDPTSFGQFDSTTIQWLPKAYTGTYGTNGFHLDFSSGASLGADSSENNNTWAPAGTVVQTATLNQVIDTPLNNFATLNPLSRRRDVSILPIFANGNLRATHQNAGGSATYGLGTIGVTSGKYYWEHTVVTKTTSIAFGVGDTFHVDLSGNHFVSYLDTGVIAKYGVTQTTASGFTTNDVIGVALDADIGTVSFYRNNVLQYTVTGLLYSPSHPFVQANTS
ncbi:MAG: LamG-like jellyroll fold domain-containing protein, partial [Candidatus Gracilibacteria bacterium]|nr:LamG-like jellyroll fold domain-containing protein [Candidatus Gracilibacteria bacterium]